MSFTLAANGALSSVTQVNQFQTTLSAGTVASIPTILGSASLIPLASVLSTNAGNDFVQGWANGNTAGINWAISYSSGPSGSGAGFLGFSDGTGGNYAFLSAAPNGLQTTSDLSVGNNVWVNNNLSTGGMTITGNMTINAASWSMPSGSTYNINQLGAGAWWRTGDANWVITLGDDGGTGTGPGGSTYLHTTYTGGGSTQHDLAVYCWNASNGINTLMFTCGGNGIFYPNSGVNLIANGFSRISYVSGTGTGVFSHGLGAAPSWMIGSVTGSGGSGADCLNWVGNSSSFSMSAGTHTWVAIAYAA